MKVNDSSSETKIINGIKSRRLTDIATDLGKYLIENSIQVSEDGKLQYYICGSLGTMLLANATEIERCAVEANGNIIISSKQTIPQSARDNLARGERKIGDLDIVNVAGNMYGNSKKEKLRPEISFEESKIKPAFMRREIPDIKDILGTGFHIADDVRDGLKTDNFRTSKIRLEDGTEIFIASPEAMIAHKLEEIIKLNGLKENDKQHYKRNIKDIITMISGIAKIYNSDELINGIYRTIQEKNNSHYNEYSAELANFYNNIEQDIELTIKELGIGEQISKEQVLHILEGTMRIQQRENILKSGVEATEVGKVRDGVIDEQVDSIIEVAKCKDDKVKETIKE